MYLLLGSFVRLLLTHLPVVYLICEKLPWLALNATPQRRWGMLCELEFWNKFRLCKRETFWGIKFRLAPSKSTLYGLNLKFGKVFLFWMIENFWYFLFVPFIYASNRKEEHLSSVQSYMMHSFNYLKIFLYTGYVIDVALETSLLFLMKCPKLYHIFYPFFVRE